MLLFGRKNQRSRAKPGAKPEAKPDLVLGLGTFVVTREGVEATFSPPLEKLSGSYTWNALPFAFSATQALVKGEDGSVLGRLSRKLGLSMAEMEMLNLEMVEQAPPAAPISLSSIEADAETLKEWSANLADRCPNAEMSEVLRRLASMNVGEVDQYVERFLQ